MYENVETRPVSICMKTLKLGLFRSFLIPLQPMFLNAIIDLYVTIWYSERIICEKGQFFFVFFVWQAAVQTSRLGIVPEMKVYYV